VSLMALLVLLLIAGIAGAIGQSIAGYSLGGCLVSAAVGLIGALLGGWLAASLGLPEVLVLEIGGQPFPVVWAILGATLFSFIVGLITRGTRPVV
jgi:uncharacterized membrane protein YeaQ/YmgE (transglycosylase-associated protein family)